MAEGISYQQYFLNYMQRLCCCWESRSYDGLSMKDREKQYLLLNCLILDGKQAFPPLDLLFSGDSKRCVFFFYFQSKNLNFLECIKKNNVNCRKMKSCLAQIKRSFRNSYQPRKKKKNSLCSQLYHRAMNTGLKYSIYPSCVTQTLAFTF